MNQNNTQVSEFLDYYFELPISPRYAVMIDGLWGSGKTWFVDDALEKWQAKGKKMLRVSLYGMTSPADIEDEFFRQLNPFLASKKMALASKVLKGLAKGVFKVDLSEDKKESLSLNFGLSDLDLTKEFATASDRILVFDDLERCSIPVTDLLGYINYFVEYAGHKVILVANEEEILARARPTAAAEGSDGGAKTQEHSAYERIKEKLVGKTLEIEPEAEDALTAFLRELPPKHADLIRVESQAVVEIYAASGYKNLRHLRQALLDFSRLIGRLETDALKKSDLIRELLYTYLVYSFETRSGNMSAAEIPKLHHNLLGFISGDESIKKRVTETRRRYAAYFPYESSLAAQTWRDIFETGLFDQAGINEQLLRSKHFIHERQPDWAKLWNSASLDDASFAVLLADVSKKFESGRFTQLGPLMHVTGLLLAFANDGLYSRPKAEIVAMAKKNVDGLDRAEFAQAVSDPHVGRSDNFAGHRFTEFDSPEFWEFGNHVEQAAIAAVERGRPDEARTLLGVMSKDSSEFVRLLVGTDRGAGHFWDVPVLANLPAEAFALALFGLPATDAFYVVEGLQRRYANTSSPKVDEGEHNWLAALVESIKKESEARKGRLSGRNLGRMARTLEQSLNAVNDRRETRMRQIASSRWNKTGKDSSQAATE